MTTPSDPAGAVADAHDAAPATTVAEQTTTDPTEKSTVPVGVAPDDVTWAEYVMGSPYVPLSGAAFPEMLLDWAEKAKIVRCCRRRYKR